MSDESQAPAIISLPRQRARVRSTKRCLRGFLLQWGALSLGTRQRPGYVAACGQPRRPIVDVAAACNWPGIGYDSIQDVVDLPSSTRVVIEPAVNGSYGRDCRDWLQT